MTDELVERLHELKISEAEHRKFWQRVDRSIDGCWMWLGPKTLNKAGMRYGEFTTRAYGKRSWRAHRLSWSFVNGPVPDGLRVLHSCDNPPCVNPDHLRAGTQRDNIQDCLQRGRRSSTGEKNGFSKLTERDVLDIRAALASGRPKNALARQYGVSFTAIHYVALGQTWGHVK